jgi:acyl-CoA synthetase (AMP-forming)/AMP-acid ligase II
MSTIHVWAETHPDKPAAVFGNGDISISYGTLEERSRRLALALRGFGLEPGDGVAVLLANEVEFFEIFWACHRAGLYFTPVNFHLQGSEARYIVDDCDAKVFVASAPHAEIAMYAADGNEKLGARLCIGGAIDGFEAYESVLDSVATAATLDNALEGATMLYSSGTTGQPKGVRAPLPGTAAGDPKALMAVLGFKALFGLDENDRYLSPAPLYHAAPLMFCSIQQRIGATPYIMPRFDAELALDMIEDQSITTSQWVPTMFRRLLQLPEELREAKDMSSLRLAVHAAAPCPAPVKQAMIDWWGPIVVEYYAGTEGGGTLIHSAEWLEHRGSVGRHWAGGTIHILDEDDEEITEPRSAGAIYFEAPQDASRRFRYHKDDEKTAGVYRGNLFTLGDVGYLDEDGYLFLTDRKAHMIISGGVNIYPQETEDALLTHPKVDDCAVIGVPNEEMGEEVKAVVVPIAGNESGSELERELIDFCREQIAHYKCPRSIDFVTELPRLPTGKLLKRLIRDEYWKQHEGRLV